MRTFLVATDPPPSNAAAQVLKSQPRWVSPMPNVWLVTTSEPAAQLRDRVKSLLPDPQRVLVMDVSGSDWASSISSQVNEWLHNHVQA